MSLFRNFAHLFRRSRRQHERKYLPVPWQISGRGWSMVCSVFCLHSRQKKKKKKKNTPRLDLAGPCTSIKKMKKKNLSLWCDYQRNLREVEGVESRWAVTAAVPGRPGFLSSTKPAQTCRFPLQWSFQYRSGRFFPDLAQVSSPTSHMTGCRRGRLSFAQLVCWRSACQVAIMTEAFDACCRVMLFVESWLIATPSAIKAHAHKPRLINLHCGGRVMVDG